MKRHPVATRLVGFGPVDKPHGVRGREVLFSLLLAVGLAAVSPMAHSASQTWSGSSIANGNWSTTANWAGGAAPGSTSATNNSDTATFNSSILNTWGISAGNPVVFDSATQNIRFIAFDANADSFFLGSSSGNSLRLTSAGGVQVLSTLTGTGKIFTVNAPLIIGAGTAAVSGSMVNNSDDLAGVLVLGGQISGGSTNASGSTTLTLGGANAGLNTVSGNIVNGSSANGMNVVKSGSGLWRLTGQNTFTGATTVTGGTLLLDMNAGGSLAATSPLVLGFTAAGSLPSNGRFQIQGENGGASAQTLGNLTVSGNSVIELNPGTGGGTLGLTLGSTWTRAAASGGVLNVDLSAGNVSLNTSVALINDLIAGASNNASYATVTDAGGTGFATVVGGQVVRYTGATALVAGTPSSSTNYITSGFTLTASSNVLNTLQVDADVAGVGTGSGILDLNEKSLALTAKGLLVTGTSAFTIENGVLGTVSNELLIQHFGTGILTISATLGGSGAAPLTKAGPGTVVLTGTNVTSGNTTLNGGVLRATDGTGLSATSLLTINNGVFETGAATFTRTIGTSGGNVRITGGTSGFSANGGAVSVTLGGGQLVWDSVNFKPEVFVLNEHTANNTLELTNAIDLNGASRTIHVNSATNQATISGIISSTSGGGLIKGGVGTLALSGVNTYSGATMINAGTLLVTSVGQLSNSSSVSVGASGAFVYNNNTSAYAGNVDVDGTLGGSGKIAGTIGGSGQVGPGNSPGILTAGQADPSGGLDFAFEFSATGAPNYANNTASVNDVLRLTNGTTPFTSVLDSDNEIKIYLNVASLSANDIFYGGFYTDLGTDFLATIADATFSYYLFNASGAVTYNGVNYDVYSGPFSFEVSTVAQMANFGGGDINGYVTQFTAVPEPGTSLLVGLGLVGVLYGFRRRRA